MLFSRTDPNLHAQVYPATSVRVDGATIPELTWHDPSEKIPASVAPPQHCPVVVHPAFAVQGVPTAVVEAAAGVFEAGGVVVVPDILTKI